MANAHVPKFGNWGSNNAPFTQYFDNARKDRMSAKIINPNDPSENPESFLEDSLEVALHTRPTAMETQREVMRAIKARKSPFDPPVRRTPPHEHQKGATKMNGGPDRSIETSPHSRHQGKTLKGGGLSMGNAGRSKLQTHYDSMEKSSAVPKFGDWDENNPASADGFTGIFNLVREEKQAGPARGLIVRNEESFNQHGGRSRPVRCSFFSFCK